MLVTDHKCLGRGCTFCLQGPLCETYLCQTEVENLGVSALGHENIGGLDVAMDDARLMRGVQRLGDVNSQRQQQFRFQRTAADAMPQRHSIEEFHRNERPAALLVNVVDGADVGMVQRRGGASFAPEALQRLPVVSQIVGKELEGDEAAKTGVLGLIHHTHPAATELLDDAVVRDGCADHETLVRKSNLKDWCLPGMGFASSLCGWPRRLDGSRAKRPGECSSQTPIRISHRPTVVCQ